VQRRKAAKERTETRIETGRKIWMGDGPLFSFLILSSYFLPTSFLLPSYFLPTFFFLLSSSYFLLPTFFFLLCAFAPLHLCVFFFPRFFFFAFFSSSQPRQEQQPEPGTFGV
jgi:hypothetical protein